MIPFLFPKPAHGQDKLYSLSVKGSFTISSRLFDNIDARDEFVRSQYVSIDDIFGFGIDVRRAIDDTRLEVGVSAEYLAARERGVVTGTKTPVEDGYWAVPVEFTGYFVIPFSSDNARLYIGGGVGVYFGQRQLMVGTTKSEVLSSGAGVGIHVLTGFGYALSSWFDVRSEIKFRDIQFESTVAHNNMPRRSRINVDGMVVDAGVAFRF